MKLIKPKFEILQSKGLYEDIEIAARTCYQSQDKIMQGSAEKIVSNLIDRGHGAMLEHGTVYLYFGPGNAFTGYKYRDNQYSKYVEIREREEPVPILHKYITTNYRVLVENGWLSDLEWQCVPTIHHEKRISVRFTCDIGVSREFNRHRVDSIAEQSTRYCNFSQDKFGNEITYIQPDWVSDEELNREVISIICNDEFGTIYEQETYKWDAIDWWLWSLTCCELAYINMIRLGWSAQQARDSLPLSTKTELIHTAFVSDWEHFFSLRDAVTAHPSARELATPLHQEFKNLNLI